MQAVATYWAYAARIVRGKGKRQKRSSVRPPVFPSVCPSFDSSTGGWAGGFAAEVGRPQQISIDSSCSRATCGPCKFWSDCKEVHSAVCYCCQIAQQFQCRLAVLSVALLVGKTTFNCDSRGSRAGLKVTLIPAAAAAGAARLARKLLLERILISCARNLELLRGVLMQAA